MVCWPIYLNGHLIREYLFGPDEAGEATMSYIASADRKQVQDNNEMSETETETEREIKKRT